MSTRLNSENVNRWLTLIANIGVVVGLALLIFELRQNSDLMRAQIAMDRSAVQIQSLSDWANGGEIIPIEVKLFEQVTGFPEAVGWSKLLTPEEKRRYHYRMIIRLTQLQNDWFQCAEGLVDSEICEREVRTRMRRNLHRFYELDLAFGRSQSSFIETMQDFASELGLPNIRDDGSWER